MKTNIKVASCNHPIQNPQLSSSEDNLIYGGGMKRVNIHPSFLKYNYDFNFVKVNRGEKRCIELRWNTRVMKDWDSSLKEFLDNGGMYGVQINNSKIMYDGVERQLLVIDFDDREFQDKVIDKFPKTFTTSSGSKKNCLHLWFATDRLESKFNILDEENNTLADVLGKHGQIVAPNSLHPSGSIYEVINDMPIVFIPYDEVLCILKPYTYMKKEVQKVVAATPKVSYGSNSFYNEVRNKINVIDVLNELGIDTQRNRTNCPMHESESGECFSFTSECWNCWHCGKSGNLFTLIKEIYKLDTRETFEKLAELTGLEDELREQQVEYMKGGGQ